MKPFDVLVIGAGVMGEGIAQVAAQAGHRVYLFDQRQGAADHARTRVGDVLGKLMAKGKLTIEDLDRAMARLVPVAALKEAASARVAIEAIVEKLEPKRALIRELEQILPEEAILATNTSSISVTAIAAGSSRPERIVGMHFFNPVPLMALVEVVSGLRTDSRVAAQIAELSRAWGKVPVHARSTPGFIVNRIARPFYAESLMLLQDGAASPELLDATLRGAGFRMGPCELMDLIGHDTNFAVTQSVFEANFFDRRFTPSLVQRELVEGGLLGRKSGQGFYKYPEGAPILPGQAHPRPDPGAAVDIYGEGPAAEALSAKAERAGIPFRRVPSSEWIGVAVGNRQLRLTDGRTAWQVARDVGVQDVAVFDELPVQDGARLAYAVEGSDSWRAQAPAWLQALGWEPVGLADLPGLVVARTIAMLVNEASDAVQQAVCTPEGADAAMKLGTNYPAGPFEWLERMGAARIMGILEALDGHYRGERYRVSPRLRSSA